jgi:hypothetical protein
MKQLSESELWVERRIGLHLRLLEEQMRETAGSSFAARPEFALAVGATLMMLVGPLLAGDGKLEINQSCIAVGCFPGDTAGFPVTITSSGSYLLTGNLEVHLNRVRPRNAGFERLRDVRGCESKHQLWHPG